MENKNYIDIDLAKEYLIKLECLERYMTQEPKPFFQLDYYANRKRSDRPGDGSWAELHETYELIHDADIRILIKPDIPPEIVSLALKRARKWIKDGALDSMEIHPEDHMNQDITCGPEIIPF